MHEHNLVCRCIGTEGFLPRNSKFYIPEAKRHFAPDRLVDVEHIKLELNVDLPTQTLRGVCTTNFRAVAPVVDKLTFDAIDLVVDQVLDEKGNELKFDQKPDKLIVNLKSPVGHDEHSFVAIRYHVVEPRAGLYFIAPDQYYPNRPWQLWTQGQDQDNRYWIPCHDSPNEKASTEMIVTVDEKYMAVSNGKLIHFGNDSAKKTRTFHYKQAIPHASYLITLCVGEYVEMEDSWKNSRGQDVPVFYYTFPGREEETQVSFGKTPKMMEFYSKAIGVDYPYEKYAQVLAYDFIYGGMENTSATTQMESTLHPEALDLDYSSEPLVAHELAHQWFGDLLTCKEWPHAWLNEGFATYFEALWTEFEHETDEFLYELFENFKAYQAEDSGHYRRPIVTNTYMSPSDIFDRHLYQKGSLVLHMLRKMVGDELWWKSIKRYVTNNYAKTVETVDLQRAFEDTTGRALSWFFDQWVFRGGHPKGKVTYEWVEDRRLVKISLKQTQKEDELTSTFRFPFQVKIVTAQGEKIHDLEVTKAEESFAFSCEEKPLYVSVNPERTILCDFEFNPGSELLIHQLHGDKDVMGRVAAARQLAKDHSRRSVEALGEALSKEQFWGVQVEICEALGQIGSARAVQYVVEAGLVLKHPKARRVAVRVLGVVGGEKSAEAIERMLRSDESPLVQYESGVALAKTKAPGVFERLSSALGKRESWHEYYDRGILMGLAHLNFEERVLPILLEYAKPGKSSYIRRDIVPALARYGRARPSTVTEVLIELTRDTNYFVRLFAIGAIAELRESRGAGALQRVVDSVVDPRTRRAAIESLKSVREGSTQSEASEKLKTDFDKLQERYRELLTRVEKLEDVRKPV